MKRILAAAFLAVALTACDDPADTAECREWQVDYKGAEAFDDATRAALQAPLLRERPEGCPIP